MWWQVGPTAASYGTGGAELLQGGQGTFSSLEIKSYKVLKVAFSAQL